MNFGALNKIGALLLRFLDTKKATEPVAVIPPQKTDIVKISEEEFFPRMPRDFLQQLPPTAIAHIPKYCSTPCPALSIRAV